MLVHEYNDQKIHGTSRNIKNFVSRDSFTLILYLFRFSHLSAYIDAILKLIPASSTETVVMVRNFL